MKKLTHFDKSGKARMVDVSEKGETLREATASAIVLMKRETLNLIKKNKLTKGDCLGVAKIAGILAAKKVADLIPLTHPLKISHCEISFEFEDCGIKIYATVKTKDVTGVEMEALTACAIAGLTIYDMAKAVDKEMVINDLCLLEKKGGRSGHYIRKSMNYEL